MFEPFTQADVSTTRIYGGTGLGLAIAREIASSHRGALQVARGEAGGTVVTVRLPAATEGSHV